MPVPDDAKRPRSKRPRPNPPTPAGPPAAGVRPGVAPEPVAGAANGSETPTRVIRAGVGLGTELIARQPTPAPGEAVAVPKVCPHCGTEYETDARFCPKDGAALRPLGGGDTLVGSTLADRYHILKLVGEGGMGRVYLAEHVRMNRQCAVKVMRSTLVHDADAAARFGREASSAANILHPNVAAVFDFGESEGMVYLVMEYVDGDPLSNILEREGKIEPARAADLARQVADGLAAAHELGIIHRDLKPDNILVAQSKSGREIAKVVDFGIAKAAAEGQSLALTRTGLVIGTPEFMSPEQLLGDPIDARSDIYGLGCILYLMLVGRPAADAPTRDAMLKRRLREAPPHPRALVAEISPELDAIVVKMLATAPADRFPSAAATRDALAALAEVAQRSTPTATIEAAVPSSATAAGGDDPLATPRSVPTLKMDAVPTPPASPLNRRLVTIGAGAAALVLAVTLLVRGGSRAASPPATPPANNSALAQPTVGAVPPASLPANPAAAKTHARADSVAAAGKTAAASATRQRRTASGTSTPGAALPVTDRAAAPTTTADRTPSGPRTALEQFRAAVGSQSIDQIRDVYPNLTSDQARYFGSFFEQASDIAPRLEITSSTVRDGSATLGFTMRLEFHYKTTHELGTNTTRYEAALERNDGHWVIRSLRTLR